MTEEGKGRSRVGFQTLFVCLLKDTIPGDTIFPVLHLRSM